MEGPVPDKANSNKSGDINAELNQKKQQQKTKTFGGRQSYTCEQGLFFMEKTRDCLEWNSLEEGEGRSEKGSLGWLIGDERLKVDRAETLSWHYTGAYYNLRFSWSRKENIHIMN